MSGLVQVRLEQVSSALRNALLVSPEDGSGLRRAYAVLPSCQVYTADLRGSWVTLLEVHGAVASGRGRLLAREPAGLDWRPSLR